MSIRGVKVSTGMEISEEVGSILVESCTSPSLYDPTPMTMVNGLY